MTKAAAPVYQIKITLRDSKPLIWRRINVSSETKLSQFHDIIQTVMGWQDSHLHLFRVGVVQFSYPYVPGHLEELTAVDTRYVRLSHLVSNQRPFQGEFGFTLEYEYDFGDGWKHDVIFEDIFFPDPKVKLPVCLAGERACPPEDVGGISGYETLLESLQDPSYPEHETYLQWVGEAFDPNAFDLHQINMALRQLK